MTAPERMLAGEPRSDIFPHPAHHVHPADIMGEIHPPPTFDPVVPREPIIPAELINPAGGKMILLFLLHSAPT